MFQMNIIHVLKFDYILDLRITELYKQDTVSLCINNKMMIIMQFYALNKSVFLRIDKDDIAGKINDTMLLQT